MKWIYTRGQYFYGGKKPELDARRHIVKEIETGIEFQIIKQLEFTVAYTIFDRVFEDSKILWIIKRQLYEISANSIIKMRFNESNNH